MPSGNSITENVTLSFSSGGSIPAICGDGVRSDAFAPGWETASRIPVAANPSPSPSFALMREAANNATPAAHGSSEPSALVVACTADSIAAADASCLPDASTADDCFAADASSRLPAADGRAPRVIGDGTGGGTGWCSAEAAKPFVFIQMSKWIWIVAAGIWRDR